MSEGLNVKAPGAILHAIKRLVAEDLDHHADIRAPDATLLLTSSLRVVQADERARVAQAPLLLTPSLAVAPAKAEAAVGEDEAIIEMDQNDLQQMVAALVAAEIGRLDTAFWAERLRPLVRAEVARALAQDLAEA